MWKLLACLALLIVVNAQFTVRVVDDEDTFDVGTWSNWIYVETATAPNTTFDIDIAAWNSSNAVNIGDLTIEPSRLTFSPIVQSLAFRVRHTVIGQYFLNFSKGDDGGQFPDVADLSIDFVPRTFSFLQWASPVNLVAGLPSEPFSVWVSTPPVRQLTLTPTSNDTTITFPRGGAVIPAGARSGTFIVQGANTGNFLSTVTWDVQGDDEGYYFRDLEEQPTFNIVPRQITITSPGNVNIQLGSVNSTGFNVFIRDAANSSFTITPQAANTVFTPASATFNSGTSQAFFSFSSDADSDVVKNVRFYTSGDDRYLYTLDPAAVTYRAPKRVVRAIIGAQNIVVNRTHMSVSIQAPVKTALTVSFTASNIRFNVSSVEFKNNITAFTVAITNDYLGADAVYFSLSGADYDAGFFSDIAPLTVPTIIRGNFIGPANWYVPDLWVAVESDKIPIRASISPRDSVTITPVATNVIFRPSSLTFRNGTEQQYFTITPLYNSLATESFTTTVTWFISGNDNRIFDLPASFPITVNARSFQAADSAHLNTAEIDRRDTDNTRHLHKTYKIWTSVNYIGKNEHFSVTPTSPYYSFKPSVLFFNDKNTRIMLEATVTGVPASGVGRIDYIYGGQDGGLYTPATPETRNLALRPLEIVAAVVSPDERSKGVFLARDFAQPTQFLRPAPSGYDPVAQGALRNYHVHSFKVRSFVLPDKSLTITPRCAHATFSPSKITLKGDDGVKQQDYWPVIQGSPTLNDTIPALSKYYFNVTNVYLEANFSVTAQAAGTHRVWFELSGDDKDYYSRVAPTDMTFNLVMRPSSEPYRASSSSFLLPSFVVIAAMAVLSLVM